MNLICSKCKGAGDHYTNDRYCIECRLQVQRDRYARIKSNTPQVPKPVRKWNAARFKHYNEKVKCDFADTAMKFEILTGRSAVV